MKAFQGGGEWLFAFTHPDDEISICAWIKRLVDSGADVWCGWSVTDPVREAEGRAVMRRLGVSQEKLFFFGMPDKGACDYLEELSEKWRGAIEIAKPERIALGAFECGHIDHDSTNFAVRSALLHPPAPSSFTNQNEEGKNSPHPSAGEETLMLEIPFYHTYLTRVPILNRFARPEGEEVLYLRPEEWALKKEMSRSYKSQNIGSLLVWYTLLGWVKGRPAGLCRTERMRVQTHFDYLTPNLPSPLKEKVMESETWNRWVRAVQSL